MKLIPCSEDVADSRTAELRVAAGETVRPRAGDVRQKPPTVHAKEQ